MFLHCHLCTVHDIINYVEAGIFIIYLSVLDSDGIKKRQDSGLSHKFMWNYAHAYMLGAAPY